MMNNLGKADPQYAWRLGGRAPHLRWIPPPPPRPRPPVIRLRRGALPGDSAPRGRAAFHHRRIIGERLGFAIGIVSTLPFSHATPVALVMVGPLPWRVGYGLWVAVIDGQALAAADNLALPGE